VADDGSGPATRELVKRFAKRAAHPVRHAWDAHQGFRLCHIRNLALSMTRADYVVQLDGDMVLHPQFIADHRRAAAPGTFVQGTRILADERLTQSLLRDPTQPVSVASRGLGGLRRIYAVHSPLISRAFGRAANSFIAIKGCNQGFWRADLERINGYDEDMSGWGSEDKELTARLKHCGVQRRTLWCGGIAYHLHHPAASRDRHALNQEILARTLRERRTACTNGLSLHRA